MLANLKYRTQANFRCAKMNLLKRSLWDGIVAHDFLNGKVFIRHSVYYDL